MSCLNSRHLSCLSSRHQSCINSRHVLYCKNKECLLLQDQPSVLSQHTMLMSQKSQLWQCHSVQVSEVSIVAMSQCSSLRKPVRPQIIKNAPKWFQNGRQDLRIDPRACHGHLQDSGNSPAAKKHQKMDLRWGYTAQHRVCQIQGWTFSFKAPETKGSNMACQIPGYPRVAI